MKTTLEIKNERLEREQHDLIGVIAYMIDDIQTLIRYTDVERIPRTECADILKHHRHAIEVMADVIEGK